MSNITAYCGLDCNECPTFLATKSNDDEKRKEVAELWSNLYKAEIKASDINCDGCKSSGGSLFSHCNVCEIRKCAKEKAINNCSECDEYVCEKLGELFRMAPEAKQNLEQTRR